MATMEVPSQRDTALAWANRVRTTRARIKHEIDDGVTDWRDVLDMPEIAGMRLYDLLCALPRFGPFRVGRVLDDLRIGEQRSVGNLTERQRTALINSPLLPPRRT